jgi:hypothetical protein
MRKFNSAFRKFVLLDLFFNFREPNLLLPFIGFVVTLFLILAAVDPSGGLVTSAGVLSIIFLAVVIFAKFWIGLFDFGTENGSPEEIKDLVEDNWQFWEARIKSEFTRKVWLTSLDFNDLKISRGFSEEDFEYVLATYASKYPDQARFGSIIDRYKQVRYAFEAIVEYNALVNLETLDQNRYYVN